MVTNLGWTESPDVTDKHKWCDMDYMAEWIRSKDYAIKTTVDNLINMIFAYYEETEEVKDNGYYAVKDSRKYPDNLMVNIEDISAYVEEQGGLKEFDFYC